MKMHFIDLKKFINNSFNLNEKSKKGKLTSSLGFAFGTFFIANLVLNSFGIKNAPKKPQPEMSSGIVSTIDDESIPMRDRINISPDEIIIDSVEQTPIDTSLDEINDLNIIINDDDCMNEFMESVCEQLDQDGIKFHFTRNSQKIDQNDSVIISLDQQYSAGPDTLIFCPVSNKRKGNSDELALAMKTGFYEKGFFISDVNAGQIGYRENEDGTVTCRVPTHTEDAINENSNSSFVTISFGTNNNPNMVAKAIESSLSRYCSALKHSNNKDLIYSVNSDESIEDIAKHFGVPSSKLIVPNEEAPLYGQVIVNPKAFDYREFDFKVPAKIVYNQNTEINRK